MAYIDGYVLAVPRRNRAKYRALARKASRVFRDHGATRVVECWGDDLPPGKLTSFPRAVKCRDDEIVVFSWMEWPSKKLRDSGMKKAMADPRFAGMDASTMPFDGRRMIFGGFRPFVDE